MNKKFLSAVFAAVIALSASSCSHFSKSEKAAAPQASENAAVKEETCANGKKCEHGKKCKNSKKENKGAKKAKAVKAEAAKAEPAKVETKTEAKK